MLKNWRLLDVSLGPSPNVANLAPRGSELSMFMLPSLMAVERTAKLAQHNCHYCLPRNMCGGFVDIIIEIIITEFLSGFALPAFMARANPFM